MNYYDIEGFEFIYLEDSYVINILEKPSKKSIVFSMEAVLTEEHPLYTPAKKGEQYCYTNVDIVFTEINSIQWVEKNNKPSIDMDGTIDFGNIDVFIVLTDGYHLAGDWGDVLIKSEALPKVSYFI